MGSDIDGNLIKIMKRPAPSLPCGRIVLEWRTIRRSFGSASRLAAICLGLLGPAGWVPVARSDVISLIPVADTTLQEALSNVNYGLDDSIRAGGRQQGGAARGLMRFDIAGIIPAGAVINSTTLTLTVLGTSGVGVDSTFDVHRVLATWGEGIRIGTAAQTGEASWNDRLGPGVPWTTAGGDFDSAASAALSVAGNGVYHFTSDALAADVRFWLTNAADNFGWLLRSESETTPVTIRRFGSRTAPGGAPALVIDYSTVPSPAIFAVASLVNQVRFSFNAQSNRTYAVEFRESLTSGEWSTLTNFVLLPAAATLDLTNTVSSAERYFRIRTP